MNTINVKNELCGYAVATYGDYVAVTDPSDIRFSSNNPADNYTGSVDVYKYNKNQHLYTKTLYKHILGIEAFLAAENSNLLQTEIAQSMIMDVNVVSLENGFGYSVDMFGSVLAIGCPFYRQAIQTEEYFQEVSGSSVDIFKINSTAQYPYTDISFITSIENPVIGAATGSFAMSVAINENWIAVGSPSINTVYLYSKMTATSWSLAQTITSSNGSSQFGSVIKLDKCLECLTGSMIIGCGNPSTNETYYYEYISGKWKKTYTFTPTTSSLPLTFGNYAPYNLTMNANSGFGAAASLYNNTVIIGAYLDRSLQEYDLSSTYYQGAVYIFEKCIGKPSTQFRLALKTNGTSDILKNNRLGYSVDVFGNNAVAGSPKINNETMTAAYLSGSITQLHQTNKESELNGQYVLLQKNTGSNQWEITNTYQKKKRFLSPYRSFGDSVAIADQSIVIGAPITISDEPRDFNVFTTQSQAVVLDDIAGKSYIYNLNNLSPKFHIGNVFYRNGKIVVMTSGSVFNGLFYNPTNTSTYEYDLKFKGQHTIFEKQVICSVSPGEFGTSTNPTATTIQSSVFDLNHNGKFDFQDVDVVLGYMQYKNTLYSGTSYSTDWSSSVVTSADEISLLNFYKSQIGYDAIHSATLLSASISNWDSEHPEYSQLLDVNNDNKIDGNDISIVWKYFSNRLTQANYASYITPSCTRTKLSEILDYMEDLTKTHQHPQIKSDFFDYERLSILDKTGSYLAPMATSIGLYAGLDLVAVAKLGTPVKIMPELPLNFSIRMDY